MPADSAAARAVTVQAYGVTVEVTADGALLAAVRDLLPPGAYPASGPPEHGRFALASAGDHGLLDVLCDEQLVAGPVDPRVALGILDAQIRMHVALHAPEHIFVHAGVVGIGDTAVLLPARSFAGKTTLVSALVRAGADYWSDEYAVLDPSGVVHPYAKPLSVRNAALVAEEHPVESLGGRAGNRPLAVGLIAITHYRPGGSWAPRLCSAGEGAIKLLEHTIPARSRPEQALEAVSRAATGAVVLEGERGEAQEAAAALISRLTGSGGD